MLIAVYGTLRKSQHNFAVMDGKVKFMFFGLVQGQMYDLGGCPGLIKSDDPKHLCVCEVYKVTDESILTRLDRFEGYNKEQPEQSFYIREEVDVFIRHPEKEKEIITAGGTPFTFRCSVYFCNNKRIPAVRERLIEDGDYEKYMGAKKAKRIKEKSNEMEE